MMICIHEKWNDDYHCANESCGLIVLTATQRRTISALWETRIPLVYKVGHRWEIKETPSTEPLWHVRDKTINRLVRYDLIKVEMLGKNEHGSELKQAMLTDKVESVIEDLRLPWDYIQA